MIKCRAWEIEKERWITPNIEDVEESELRLDIWGNVYFRLPWFEQEPCRTTIVGGENSFKLFRGSGMHTPDGNEVFEGDILKYVREDWTTRTFVGVVVYEFGAFWVEGGEYEVLLAQALQAGTEAEVVGNTKENPGIELGVVG